MRKQKAALWIAVMLIAAAGCGNKKEQLVESGDMIVTPQDNGSAEEDENKEEIDENKEESNKEAPDENSNEKGAGEKDEGESGGSGESQGEDSLEGVVKEINAKDNFVVVSKIFTEETESGSEAVLMVGEGAENEELITVYFTENTDFQIKTVKNAGEEVTEKEGAFSDIKEESILELKGKMDAKGEEFLADEVFINEFIYS